MLLVVLVALAALGVDALSKTWAQAALPATGAVTLLGDVLRLDLGYNTGVALGFFSGAGWPLSVLIAGSIVVLAGWMYGSLRRERQMQMGNVVPFGLVMGGAVANLIDRVVDGKVTDFIDVGLGTTRWPTFNLADSFIVAGIVVLIAGNLATTRRGATQPWDSNLPRLTSSITRVGAIRS